ncbi:phosphatase PAP2 family protein [Solimonas marina]|uniref:Phosphatase PAP2 family protein n=1 Tax=Solimonas marina TaxID=2714601 RepID=A0A969WA91_9GAMM|nr:phosphatase PAP2 family protein [Solimonas marina]NKF21180.1 phosphatase PAP2 family protein [Solimonas marina]
MLRDLTAFGNSAVLLPLTLLILLWLAHVGGRRPALAWLAGFAVGIGAITLLKAYFLNCPLPHFSLHSPSGHAGFSLFVYGGISLLTGRSRPLWLRLVVIACAVFWVLLIAWSRYALHAHSIIELILGMMLGAIGLVVFVALRGELPRMHFPLFLFGGATTLLVLALFGPLHPLQFESLLARLGHLITPTLPFCSAAG